MLKVRVTPLSFFFFFQAEDGIRDLIVTGVQTCALPISAAYKALILALMLSGREAEARGPVNQLRLLEPGFTVQQFRRRSPACTGMLGERRSEEHTSELQSRSDIVCRLLLEKKKETMSCA